MEGNSNTSSSSSCHDKELEEFMGMGVLSVEQSPTQSPIDATSGPRVRHDIAEHNIIYYLLVFQ